MDINWSVFAIFNVVIIALLLIDLGVFHRRSTQPTIKGSLGWTGFWISLAMVFNVFIFTHPEWFFTADQVQRAITTGELAAGASLSDFGLLRSEQFLAGFLIEKALAVDNLFVFMLIFSAFAVPVAYQHKLLFYGILGALVLRAGFIFAGIALIEQFTWVIYVFGLVLIWTGVRMLMPKPPLDPATHWSVKLARRILPISKNLNGDRFTTIENGKRMLTPLVLVLILIECTDVIFAVDSIPAVIAISSDPFIVYTSNVFAILGLRSLYFALSGLTAYIHYLPYGLSAILIFVGLKMLMHAIPVAKEIVGPDGDILTITEPFKIPIAVSLSVIGSILLLAIVASWIRSIVVAKKKKLTDANKDSGSENHTESPHTSQINEPTPTTNILPPQ